MDGVSREALVALWAGKLAMLVSRSLGRGGTTWPGRVATALEPRLLDRLARVPARGAVVITGTNGKTTTALLLSSIARASGLQVVHNLAGANMSSGIVSAFLENVSWRGQGRGDLAVLEVDEASLTGVAPAVRPKAVVVTNFFRDQLDRYGEVDGTVRQVRDGVERCGAGTQLVLCADDPLGVSLSEARVPLNGSAPWLYFGLELPAADGASTHLTADGSQCVRCGSPYHYQRLYYSHLGHYACSACGHARPAPAVYAREAQTEADGTTRFELVTPAGSRTCRLKLPGLHNLYNALAAAAGGLALGFEVDRIVEGIESASTPFGRMEPFSVAGRAVVVALVKNPSGFNEIIRTIRSRPGPYHVVFALNDLAADGRDVSWIWDVDFEQLASPGSGELAWAICSGRRAHDMAVRVKYAGVAPDRLMVEPAIDRALRRGVRLLPPGQTLFVLPTYTAMLSARRVLALDALPRASAGR